MKKCANCDLENPDDASNCLSCSLDTFVSTSEDAVGGHIISPQEESFWKHLTLRQLAVLFVRVQGLWFFFNALFDLTYLPSYLSRISKYTPVSSAQISDLHSFFWMLSRIALNVAAGIVCIRYTDRILSWIVKDIVPKKPAGDESGSTETKTGTATQ